EWLAESFSMAVVGPKTHMAVLYGYQLIHSVSRKRERQAGVAVHGRGVSRWSAQLEFAMLGWSVPPWGLLPQDAGQREGRGLRLQSVG
ncbi:MAG: hypothetical protein ACK6D4_05215, partial [Planctomyces sp.]